MNHSDTTKEDTSTSVRLKKSRPDSSRNQDVIKDNN